MTSSVAYLQAFGNSVRPVLKMCAIRFPARTKPGLKKPASPGSIAVDFFTEDFLVRCPFVLLGILTPMYPVKAGEP